MAGDELYKSNYNGNLIRVDSEGGVVTKFGNVQETYQLSEDEAQDLAGLLADFESRGGSSHGGLLQYIPAPKLVDLSVGMTSGDISFGEFKDIKESFEFDKRILSDYRLTYEVGIKKTDGACSQPCTDVSVLQGELDKITQKLKRVGDMEADITTAVGNPEQPDPAQPVSVQQVDFTSRR